MIMKIGDKTFIVFVLSPPDYKNTSLVIKNVFIWLWGGVAGEGVNVLIGILDFET